MNWILLIAAVLISATAHGESEEDLAAEVRGKGWIVFSARSEKGDWDLFAMRPDGSERFPMTETPDWSEFLPRFTADGGACLYRRVKPGETIDGNRHGEQGELVLVDEGGKISRVLAGDGEMAWASWTDDPEIVATLSVKGISFIDIDSGEVIRTLPRKGFFQQLSSSPDGKWLVGVSNQFGTAWSVARMNAKSGKPTAVSKMDCCTPEWAPISDRVLYSSRPAGQKSNGGQGWTQLWIADGDGKNNQLIFGEDGRHIYGGHLSPDEKYVIFTGNPKEDGDPQNSGAPMGLLRLSDAPVVAGESKELKKVHPRANTGPVLELPAGWEPFWTDAKPSIFPKPTQP